MLPVSKTYELAFEDNTLTLEKRIDDTYVWRLASHPNYSVTFTQDQIEDTITFLTSVLEVK